MPVEVVADCELLLKHRKVATLGVLGSKLSFGGIEVIVLSGKVNEVDSWETFFNLLLPTADHFIGGTLVWRVLLDVHRLVVREQLGRVYLRCLQRRCVSNRLEERSVVSDIIGHVCRVDNHGVSGRCVRRRWRLQMVLNKGLVIS